MIHHHLVLFKPDEMCYFLFQLFQAYNANKNIEAEARLDVLLGLRT